MRVVEALEKNVPDIVSVELTRAFEEKMEDIMAGKAKRDEVIEESKEGGLIRILRVFKEKELDIGRMLLETTGTGVTTSRSSAKKAGAVKELSEEEENAVRGGPSMGKTTGGRNAENPSSSASAPSAAATSWCATTEKRASASSGAPTGRSATSPTPPPARRDNPDG